MKNGPEKITKVKGFKWRRGRRGVNMMNLADFASCGVGMIVGSPDQLALSKD